MIHMTIIAHGNGLAAFRRHIPLWQEHHADAALVLVPENDPIEQQESPWPVVRLGNAEHNGVQSRIRLRWLLDHLSQQTNCSHFIIHEYDSFSLSGHVKFQTGFCGNVFGNWDRDRFLAWRYVNPPWTVDYGGLCAMWKAARRWPDLLEEGEADRYLSALAVLANVPILPHDPKGYSYNWITEKEVAPMRKAIYDGGTLIHGVKQKWVLEAALQFYDERPKQ